MEKWFGLGSRDRCIGWSSQARRRNLYIHLILTDEIQRRQSPQSARSIVKGGSCHREFLNDPERCEYFVPVQWLQTEPLENAVHEIGLFGNRNTVCKPTTPKWRSTLERLKEKFPNFDKVSVA